MSELYTEIAESILQWIRDVLAYLHVSPEKIARYDQTIYVVLVLLLAIALSLLLRWIVIRIIHIIVRYRGGKTLKKLVSVRLINRTSHIIPPIVLLALLPFAFHKGSTWLHILEKLCWVYLTGAIIFSTNTLLSVLWSFFYANSGKIHNRPMKGLVQIVQGILLGLGAIIAGSILLDRSPATLITGLGAFAAVLMLIFKDSILGFVAGVQLSQNDMIRNGDWIVVEGSQVDGIVVDVSLNTVKVQNFDNTIITLPPYSLVSGSVQNWRGMSESGGRRIMHAYLIDLNTVQFCTDEMLEDLKQIELLRDFIEKKQAQKAAGKVENVENSAGLVNGSIETNLGLFRAYMTLYLKQHRFINNDLTLMVRILEPTANGIPLQIYCFSANKVWVSYEAINAEILEHFSAILSRFGLFPFQNAASRDYINSALITAGFRPEKLWDIPQGGNTVYEKSPTPIPDSGSTPTSRPPLPPNRPAQ